MDQDEFTLSPVNFFQIGFDCHQLPEGKFPRLTLQNYRKYLLPDTAMLCSQDTFARMAMGWHAEGLELLVQVDQAYQQCFYPDFQKGDSLELCLDTRDVKTSGYNTRFCHHFFFLPEAVEGTMGGELTRFRTEDRHDLCDPKELLIKSQFKENQYSMQIFVPLECLHGYDPEQFNRLGFTYRINRLQGEPQHFSVVSEEYQIEQQPSLWSTIKFIK